MASKKNKWIVVLIVGAFLILALLTIFLIIIPSFSQKTPLTYKPGEYPERINFADTATTVQVSPDECYNAYDQENDPVHPVLDVKINLSISNTGNRPGVPRSEQNEPQPTQPASTPLPAPSPTPKVTINPGTILPGVNPSIDIPNIQLPGLYIINSKITGPLFTGDKYSIQWRYTAARKATFSVSISTSGGRNFSELVRGLTGDNYELTLPDTPGKKCVIRITAFVENIEYKHADTEEFVLLSPPEPASTPIQDYIDPQVQYINLPCVRINSAIDLPVWFKAENKAENAERLVWQLSKVEFWGTKESFGDDAGIIASGDIDMSLGGEFSIDIKTICDELTKPSSKDGGKPILLDQNVYDFFIRVVALDKNGECIGDPGRGLQFSYGVPDVIANLNQEASVESSEIALLIEMPYYDKWQWKRVIPDVLNRDISSPPDSVLFSAKDNSQKGSDIIQKAVQVELQVATSPFTNADTLGLTEPEGLVYSYLDTAPDIGKSANSYTYQTAYFHGIEYKQFIPSKEELDAMGGIYYYVRAVFFVPDDKNPSVLRPKPSETLTIAFRVTSAKQNEVKKVVVKSNIPFTQFLRYEPVKWQDPNYDEYFEVTRHIEAEEMTFSIKNSDTGDFLLPYVLHCQLYNWTREQYQAKLDQMLPSGAVIHYIKSEPGFWDEFFSLLKAIYTAVQKAYSDAKVAVVSYVADNIPFIGNEARGYLKKAAMYAIDYGLAYVGLPPSLPNLDVLATGSLDYVMKYAVSEALKEAGIPADSAVASELSQEVRQKVEVEIAEQLKKAMEASQQNPFKAAFLRVSTRHLYRPAYIDMLIANYSKTEYSTSGTLYMTFGNGFDVYRTKCLFIPSLKPGESMTLRAYLDHTRNKYDGYGKYFDKIYYGHSEEPFEMRVYTYYTLKDVKIAAKEQGLSPAPLPYVTEYVYDRQDYSYSRDFVPAEAIPQEDSSADPSKYMD